MASFSGTKATREVVSSVSKPVTSLGVLIKTGAKPEASLSDLFNKDTKPSSLILKVESSPSVLFKREAESFSSVSKVESALPGLIKSASALDKPEADLERSGSVLGFCYTPTSSITFGKQCLL